MVLRREGKRREEGKKGRREEGWQVEERMDSTDGQKDIGEAGFSGNGEGGREEGREGVTEV